MEYCRNHPFSCGTYENNDTGVLKINSVSIHLFDFNNMCCTKGEYGAKVFKTFKAVVEIFCADEVPYENYVSLSVDNSSTMTGVNNSLASRLKQKNGNILISGCSCHVVHIAANHPNDPLSNVVRFNVENLCIDIFCRFDKIFKRWGKLRKYFQFSNQKCLCFNIYQCDDYH